jgi:hypothetical protein
VKIPASNTKKGCGGSVSITQTEDYSFQKNHLGGINIQCKRTLEFIKEEKD